MGNGFDASVGFRYLNFDNTNIVHSGTNSVVLYTGNLGKYWGDYWFSVRPFFVPGVKGWSQSYLIILRQYHTDNNYLNVTLGYGFSPDEHKYAFDVPTQYNLKSRKINISYNYLFSNRYIANLEVGYAREEYYPTLFREKYFISLTMAYKF